MTARPIEASLWGTARAIGPGLALTGALGAVALAAKWALPASAMLPDVLVALAAGALVANTPVGRWLGVDPSDGRPNRYGRGLEFVSKTLLRVSVVLMGLRIEAHLFGSARVITIAVAIATLLPMTFFTTHALAVPLRVPRAL